jgi:hypothetical protein
VTAKQTSARPERKPRSQQPNRMISWQRLQSWSGWAEDEAESQPRRLWPRWLTGVVSFLLLFHFTALLATEFGGRRDSSTLELDVAKRFWWYMLLINQDYTHAFFAPNPDSETPVITAHLRFGGKRPDREIRIPDRTARPHIRFVRQIAMAWHLTYERSTSDPLNRSYWAASYARHLCRSYPGCVRVELSLRMHQTPPTAAVLQAIADRRPLDLESEDWYGFPISLGEFPCE